MKSRSFNKRIDLWEVTSVPDGYGGYKTQTKFITKSWANVQTFQPGKRNNISEFGLTSPQNTVIFTVRKRRDLLYNIDTMFVKYRGVDYTISTSPTNVDFNDSTIIFMGVAKLDKNQLTNEGLISYDFEKIDNEI